MDWKCSICGKPNGLFTIEIPAEEEGELSYGKNVCASCWDIIAQVSLKAIEVNFDKLMKKYLENHYES